MNKKLMALVVLAAATLSVNATHYPNLGTVTKVWDVTKHPVATDLNDKVVAVSEVVFLSTFVDVVRHSISDKEEMTKFVKAFFTPWRTESRVVLKAHKLLTAELMALIASGGTLAVEAYRDQL